MTAGRCVIRVSDRNHDHHTRADSQMRKIAVDAMRMLLLETYTMFHQQEVST